MRNHWIIAAALVVGLAGCGKADEAIKELDAIKKTACECKDPACLAEKQVDKQVADWRHRHETTKGSQSQKDKCDAIQKEILACVEKAQAPADEPEEGAEKK